MGWIAGSMIQFDDPAGGVIAKKRSSSRTTWTRCPCRSWPTGSMISLGLPRTSAAGMRTEASPPAWAHSPPASPSQPTTPPTQPQARMASLRSGEASPQAPSTRPGSSHQVGVGTVIGFPHGGHRPDVKVFEAERALDDGARELDMVVNIGKVLSRDWPYVAGDIRGVVQTAHPRGAIVKVIFENCFLQDEHK